MKYFVLSIAFLAITPAFAQKGGSSTDALMREAINLHDAGQYEEAIEIYSDIIEEEPENLMAYYERAYSYSSLMDCESAIDDYKEIIDIADPDEEEDRSLLLQSYMGYANCLDDLGNPEAAIDQYEEAEDEFGEFYLITYNKGLTHWRMDEPENAEDCFEQSALMNVAHASSSVALSEIVEVRNGSTTKQLNSLLWFIMLEPNSARTEISASRFDAIFNHMVSDDGDNVITINIGSGEDDRDEDFTVSDLFISMSMASNRIIDSDELDSTLAAEGVQRVNRFQSDEMAEHYFRVTSLIGFHPDFDDKDEASYWKLIDHVYSELDESEHKIAFAYWTGQPFSDEAVKWVEDNQTEIAEMFELVNKSIETYVSTHDMD